MLIAGSRFLSPYARRHPYRVVLLCALVVVFLGLVTGGATYGSGYEQARHLLTEEAQGDWTFPWPRWPPPWCPISPASRAGCFPQPGRRRRVGNVLGGLFPGISVVGLTLVAMAAFLAAVIQRPITSFVIVMELTGNRHDILLPLMAGAFLAAAVSKIVWLRPLYDSLADRLQEGEGMALDRARVVGTDGGEEKR